MSLGLGLKLGRPAFLAGGLGGLSDVVAATTACAWVAAVVPQVEGRGIRAAILPGLDIVAEDDATEGIDEVPV